MPCCSVYTYTCVYYTHVYECTYECIYIYCYYCEKGKLERTKRSDLSHNNLLDEAKSRSQGNFEFLISNIGLILTIKNRTRAHWVLDKARIKAISWILYIPDDGEISRGPRDISKAEGNLEVIGDVQPLHPYLGHSAILSSLIHPWGCIRKLGN